MFSRLRSLFGNSRRTDLFYFHDGTKLRRIDPLIAAQMLALHPLYRPEMLRQAFENGDIKAQQITAQAARDAFGVHQFDAEEGTGLTETQCVTLMENFDQYLWQVKKNTSHSPTSPSFSGATPKTSTNTTTKDSSHYGSAETVPRSETPTGSESEQSPHKTPA